MEWQHLYSTQRSGMDRNKAIAYDPVRNSYQQDYDRIIFSSPFRRLQNKTQVFPLPGSVFVHNRLTHSLEVASVGRSLGKAVGVAIADKHNTIQTDDFQAFYRYELPSVIAAACLAHDIGNPPFGHSGEDAIRTYFTSLQGDLHNIITTSLSQEEFMDFACFEGNSNALRVLTHSNNNQLLGGFRLTYSTLASIIKYPCSSKDGFKKEKNKIWLKKSGYFQSEVEVYADIAQSMGIPRLSEAAMQYARHPFVYLTEAADDICYRVIDLEDAHRLKIIDYATFASLFLPFFEGNDSEYYSTAYIQKKLEGMADDNQRVEYIRARWIGLMSYKVSQVFMEQEQALLAGQLGTDLLHCLTSNDLALLKAINDFSVKHIYNYRSVVEIELAGYNIIGGLLAAFVEAILKPDLSKSSKLLQLIPAQFKVHTLEDNVYKRIQTVVDYISGMTDLYAMDLYRKITGISIPEIK